MGISKKIEKSGKKFLSFVTGALVKSEILTGQEIIPSEVKRVLIVHQDRKLGNFILTTPLIECTKEVFPNALIDLVVAKNLKELADDNPYLNSIITFDHISFIKNPYSFYSLIETLKNNNYSVAIESSNPSSTSYLNGFITYASKAKYRIGFAGGGGSLFTNIHIPPDPEKHYYINQQRLVSFLLNDKKILKPGIFANKYDSEKKKEEILKKFNITDQNKIVGLWIGARHNKKWDIKNFKLLYSKILNEGKYFPLLLFGKEELEDYNRLESSEHNKILVTELRELKLIISACDKFICGDTGPLHFSFALNVPTIGIFLQDNYTTYGYADDQQNYIIKPSELDKMIEEIMITLNKNYSFK